VPDDLTAKQLQQLLDGPRIGVLTTTRRDGSPASNPVWFKYHEGELLIQTGDRLPKVNNIRRDPRICLLVQDERPPYKAVSFYGKAEIRPRLDWLDAELPRRYLGAIGALGYRQAAKSQIQEGVTPVVIALRPERTVSFDYGAQTPTVGKAWLWLKRFLPRSL